jgi:calcineurin-like phosphoesterase family protein
MHVLSGIRTRDASKRAAADLLLRLHGRRNRPSTHFSYPTSVFRSYQKLTFIHADSVKLYVCNTVKDNNNNKTRSRNRCCRGKAVIIIYSALIIQHATRMRRNILSSETCLAQSYFSML